MEPDLLHCPQRLGMELVTLQERFMELGYRIPTVDNLHSYPINRAPCLLSMPRGYSRCETIPLWICDSKSGSSVSRLIRSIVVGETFIDPSVGRTVAVYRNVETAIPRPILTFHMNWCRMKRQSRAGETDVTGELVVPLLRFAHWQPRLSH